jgi:hypothetical protein
MPKNRLDGAVKADVAGAEEGGRSLGVVGKLLDEFTCDTLWVGVVENWYGLCCGV